jgi:di/tricarboxylate transporter
LLTKILFPIKLKEIPGGKELIHRQLKEIGSMSVRERIVAVVFTMTAILWIIQQQLVQIMPELSDTVIAIFGALLLFMIPVDFKKGDFVLGWDDAKRLPWDILVLFGGGLSLAAAISSTGLATWMGESLRALDTWPVIALVLLSLTIIIFLTEVTSNTATAAAFMPILASVVLGWDDAKRLPWDILVLFGGGLSLAAAISSTGLATWMGESLRALDTWPVIALVLLSLTIIIFLTEVTSNTATAAAFMPILASVAIALNIDPLVLVIPAALGASCAFMLPVATPPNAIVYGSGFITMPQMAKAGFWLNIMMIFVITGMMYMLLGYTFGVTF